MSRWRSSQRTSTGLLWVATVLQTGLLLACGPASGERESEKDGATGAAQAMLMRYQQRSAGRDSIPRGALLDAKEQIEAMQDRQSHLRDAGLWTWTWLGPGNIGGRIRAIAIHPTIPSRMWIGGASGGLWRSNDGGDSWAPVNDFLPSLAITSIVIDPNNTNTMYAATGEGIVSTQYFEFDQNYATPPGAGILKSTDGGVTWDQLASTDNIFFDYVNRLAIDPATSDLYAACAPGHIIWKSANDGASWDLLLLTPGVVSDVKVSPNVTNRVFVGTQGDSDDFGDVFYSTDYGENWVEQTTGAAGKLPNDTGRCETAFGPGDVAYVLMDRSGGQVWRSTNIGSSSPTWTLQTTINVLGTQGWYNNVIWVDPTNSSFVLIGGIDLWRSTNGGTSFTKISDWQDYHTGTSAHADQHAIVPHPGYNGSTNRQIYFGNDGGIQTAANVSTVSQNSGWENLANNLGITQFYGGAASPSGSVIIGGTQDNDVLRYTGGSTSSWFQAETGDGGLCAVDFTNSSILYSEFAYLVVEKSTDGGNTWNNAVSGLIEAGNSSQTLFIAPLAMDPNNANTLWAGGMSIWRTTNGASTWSSRRGPITGIPRCTAIGVKPGNSNEVWVGYEDGTVSLTTNGGTSWTNVDAGSPALPDRWVMDIAVSPHFANEAIVTLAGIHSDNVWITTSNGASWLERTGAAPDTLPALQVNTVTYHPTNVDWIYIGTDLGVFASEDFGLHWNVTPRYEDNEGPAYVEVDDLFWYGDNLVAATYGRGMYRSRPLDTVYVDIGNAGFEDGSESFPYDTVGEGIAASGNGTHLSIETGTYTEGALLFDRKGLVTSTNGGVVVR